VNGRARRTKLVPVAQRIQLTNLIDFSASADCEPTAGHSYRVIHIEPDQFD